ncbi:MAG: heme exporter protein CcmB [Ilumatobacteraceae bacterium]
MVDRPPRRREGSPDRAAQQGPHQPSDPLRRGHDGHLRLRARRQVGPHRRRVRALLELVAPGLVWLAALFSLLLLVQRSFAIEADDGALGALRVAGVDPVAIFWGKSAALAVQLAVLDVILLGAAVLLYGADVPPAGWCCSS